MATSETYKSGIDWIDHHASMRAICQPLEKNSEEDLDENLIFEEIEGEIIKRGTLTHNTIRWDFVLEQASFLTEKEAKDFRLLTFILLSLAPLAPSPTLPSPLPLALNLVAAFVEKWGSVATPQGRARDRALTRLIDALDSMIKKAEENGLEAHYRPVITQAFEKMEQIWPALSADTDTKFKSFARRIENIAEDEVIETASSSTRAPEVGQSNKAKSPSSSSSAASATTAQAPRSGDLILDSSNERALRESLAKMADFLFDLDPAQPLSYRLRRYAGWYGMREQPALKKDEATIIMPPSEESVDLYRQAVVQKQTDIELAKRLERSCYLQPFWIEGHYIAWNLARYRGALSVANAILEEAAQFAKNAPWLEKLQFSSSHPFMPDEVKSWISTASQSGSGAGTNATQEEQTYLDTARSLAQAGDMTAAIQQMEEAHPPSADLRQRSLWELANLELLSEWGMKTHAGLTAARMEDSISTLTVADWDVGILERLRRLKSAAV